MNTGMLWFDNSATSLAQKVRKAADYYQKKYGRAAEICLVHPSMACDQDLNNLVDGITVRAWRPVLPGHLWIGVGDEPAYALKQHKAEERQLQDSTATQLAFAEVQG